MGLFIMREKVFTFIFVYIVWIILANKISYDILISGVFVSLLSSLLFSNMLFRLSSRKKKLEIYIIKASLILLFIPFFFYEAFISAIKVARHAFEIKPSFSPGIIKVKTKLTNVTAISVLANLITLTPGTLTLDFDISSRSYYIHWIDVITEEEAEIRKKTIEKFEDWLEVIFR
jgi:multicomponent Na+:H+ antiporter subunit E